MDYNKDGKRKKEKQDVDNENRKEKKSKRARSRSKSPAEDREKNSRRKRRHSKSRSPDVPLKKERDRNANAPEMKKEVPERRPRDTDMLNTRTGGAYIPPARLRMMQAQITDKSSMAYQRLAWEALKKSIHGHINKINVGNIGIIIKELLKENIVRGRGLLCRSVIQAQAASPTFTNVYAALVAAVNSRFPNIGELLLKRLVIQFKRGFKRNDKATCISSVSFVAHLINQRVAHEILALELLTLLVESPSDDSVEVAIAFLKECGQKLTEVSSKGVNAIFEMLRNILHEGQLDKRVQYMIEVMFQVWKDGFKDHPALIDELELVQEEEQFTHLLMLDDATDPQDILNVFKFDEKYEENEQKYKTLSKEILGSDAESGEEEEGSGESGSEQSDEEEENAQKPVTIIDNTETNLVALRRTIYLTINSSLDFEECAHKLMKMQLKPGQEVELCHMFLDCCAEQRTYEKFYGLLAQRFCNINRIYIGPFEEIFKDSYSTAHRLDTNRLRNVSKFFAHLLFTDSISWEVMDCVRLNEEDTTSSSRIYIKILFQELAEYMGLKKLNDRLKDPTLQEAFSGVFPRDNPKNTRFSINFFTSIGLGGLTDELREHLKQMPKNVPPPITEINIETSSSSSSSDDSSSSDTSSSDSDDDTGKKKTKEKSNSKKDKKKDKTPKTPEVEPGKDTESWGHDGFYDTYGKDARRMESRPDRRETDKDNFTRPRDFRRNDDRNNRTDHKNGDDRRNRRDENSREEFTRSNRNDDPRNREESGESRSRRGVDERNNRNADESRRPDSQERDNRRNEDRDRGSDRRIARDRNDQRRDRIDDRDTEENRRKDRDNDNNRRSVHAREDERRKDFRNRDDDRRNDDRDDRRKERDVDDSRRRERDGDDVSRSDGRDRVDDRRRDRRDKDDDRQNDHREAHDDRRKDQRVTDVRRKENHDKDDERRKDQRVTDDDRRKENRDKDDERRKDQRVTDDDRRKESRNKDDYRQKEQRETDDDRRKESRDKEDYRQKDQRETYYNDRRRGNGDKNDDRWKGHSDRDDDRQKEQQVRGDERRKDYKDRKDRETDHVTRKDEYINEESSRSKSNEQSERFERYWDSGDKSYDKNSKERDSENGNHKSRNRDREDRLDKEKRSSEDDDNVKPKRREIDQDIEKSRKLDKDREIKKKSKEDISDEDRSSRKNKKKKHKKKSKRDSSSDSSEEESAKNRYWDVMDIKTKKEAMKEVQAKDRERRARS